MKKKTTVRRKPPPSEKDHASAPVAATHTEQSGELVTARKLASKGGKEASPNEK